ncbi:chaperonin 10-like protein [Papiliotrema laurentii]|uniref:Chaperonin 10-like protein n=1 Tax=Papiliotrema laurentii TaxID=5418 RepID=A0AAD9CWW7_PAPLA|nr:chaperonin 10-like protein [Papiliotrema laurentii]
MPAEMNAVVLKSPFNVVCEKRPIPEIASDDQVIVKVQASGLCGSDLHWYRGHAKSEGNFILGHEVVGQIVAVGAGVKKFAVGDVIVSPFSLSCGDCFHCRRGNTGRCVKQCAFGTPTYDGGQAEYIRLPMADTSLIKAPEGLPKDLLVLMTDILPTGFSVAKNARVLLDTDGVGGKGDVCVVIGCGPVGLCAVSSAVTMFETVYATDIASHRLEAAAKHGAIALPLDELKRQLAEATEGRGADAVLEVVGHESALVTALDLVRPFGVLSSCGVHTQNVTLNGSVLYGKNIRMQFGRCSVPKFFDEAFKILLANRDLFSSFVENKIRLEQAAEFYPLFEQNKVAKTIFVMD